MTIEKLAEYGLSEMAETEIGNFLKNQKNGVLGLSTDGTPYIVPMAFEYDGESRLYFIFFVGETSRKVELSERAERASFLVYSADSVFFWESVLMEGSIERLPRDDWQTHLDGLDNPWHLDVFKKAETVGELQVFVFDIETQEGYKSTGLPPGMERHTE